MKSLPKKQTDILVAGSGPVSDAIVASIKQVGRKVLHIPNAESIHILSKGQFSDGTEKIGFKRALIVRTDHYKLPKVKGLDATTFYELPLPLKHPIKSGTVVILGGSPQAVETALRLAQQGMTVTLCCDELLEGYDSSLVDVVARHLKTERVNVMQGATALASLTKAGKTTVLLAQNAKTTKVSATHLIVDRAKKPQAELGLSNVEIYKDTPYLQLHGGVMLLDPRQHYSLETTRNIAETLVKGKRLLHMPIHQAESSVFDVMMFSFGIPEQDIDATHHGYKRFILKLADKTLFANCYIKVLVTLHGKVIAISGIVPATYPHLHLFKYITAQKFDAHDIASVFEPSDPLMNQILELAYELR